MGYGKDLAFVCSTPTRIVFGVGAAREAAIEAESLGVRRAFLLSDAGVAAAGLADRVRHSLGKTCVGAFQDIPQDTGVTVVERAAELARSLEADGIVSVGGGSVIDTAKAVAVLLTEGGALRDYEGLQMLTRRLVRHVAIPTTAGTGSEVTFAAVIKDHDRKQKILLHDFHLAPDVAILDPEMVASLPPRVTAFTGMDALTHAVESLHSLQAQPITDGLAMQALRLIRDNLPRCVELGSDLAARGQMLIAATIAGQAFTNAQIGVVHAMAHTLGALFGVPHGLANSILLPYGMRYNAQVCADRYALAAEALGARAHGVSDEQAADAAAAAVETLAARISLPPLLRDVGVPREGLRACAEQSLSDGAIVYNPRTVDADAVEAMLNEAW